MKELSYFRDMYSGKPCLVCGTGPSIKNLKPSLANKYITIGVNNLCQYGIDPDFLVVVDPLSYGDNNPYLKKHVAIAGTRSRYAFSVHNIPFVHAELINIQYEGIKHRLFDDMFNRNVMFASYTSVVVALSMALYMGFAKVGIIGMDLMDHDHTPKISEINNNLFHVNKWARERYQKIYNLSKYSMVEAFPKISMKKFVSITNGGI